jgi:long-chain-fatty-acid---luciferin-component ligase
MITDLAAAFRLPEEKLDILKLNLIRESLEFHYRNNPSYRGLCECAQLVPGDVLQPADLGRLPLIPVRAFKRPDARGLLSVGLENVELEVQSTGTGGIPSVARRDVLTTTRAYLAVLAVYREFFEISSGAGAFLCPSPGESPEIGMIRAYNLFCGLLNDHAYLVRDFTFDPEEAVAYLHRWAGRQTRHLFGPPFAICRLLDYLEKKNLRLLLDPESLVVTLGGWKRFTREHIASDELREKLRVFLCVPAENVRDMYGLIEANLLAVECEHHNKHIPPWCHVTIRDVDNFSRELDVGQVGVIGILDALSHSYPGFILSEDVGLIEPAACPCGRSGQIIRFVRRLTGAELGCCAVTIERKMAVKEGLYA